MNTSFGSFVHHAACFTGHPSVLDLRQVQRHRELTTCCTFADAREGKRGRRVALLEVAGLLLQHSLLGLARELGKLLGQGILDRQLGRRLLG